MMSENRTQNLAERDIFYQICSQHEQTCTVLRSIVFSIDQVPVPAS